MVQPWTTDKSERYMMGGVRSRLVDRDFLHVQVDGKYLAVAETGPEHLAQQ